MAFSGLMVLIVAALGGVALGFYEIYILVPTLQLYSNVEPLFLSESIALIILFPLVATLLTPERHESKIDSFKEEFPAFEKRFSFFKSYTTLVAKEFLDLKVFKVKQDRRANKAYKDLKDQWDLLEWNQKKLQLCRL